MGELIVYAVTSDDLDALGCSTPWTSSLSSLQDDTFILLQFVISIASVVDQTSILVEAGDA
jgi:hypothetical protein